MRPIVFCAATVTALLLLAESVSATASEFLYKCSYPTGRTQHVAFVPIAERVEGAEYTPQVVLRPGSRLFNLLARWEFPEVESPPSPEPLVYLLDGKITDEDAYRQSPETIEGVYIVCSHSDHESLGIEPGRTVIVAFTYPVMEPLRGKMQAIERMQREFAMANGHFARSLEELGWKAVDVHWVMEMTASDDGSSWSAVGRHLLLDDRSSISVSGAL